jgi:hypothetical protein
MDVDYEDTRRLTHGCPSQLHARSQGFAKCLCHGGVVLHAAIRLLPGRRHALKSCHPAFQRLHRASSPLLSPLKPHTFRDKCFNHGVPRSHSYSEQRLRPQLRLEPGPTGTFAERKQTKINTQSNTKEPTGHNLSKQTKSPIKRVGIRVLITVEGHGHEHSKDGKRKPLANQGHRSG